MNALDTIKASIPLESVNDFNANLFCDGGKLVHKSLKGEANIHHSVPISTGFNRMTLNNLNDNLILEFNARLLCDQYHEGINLNTIDRLTESLNSTGAVNLSSEALTESKVLRCDVSKNYEVEDREKSIRRMFYQSQCNIKYNSESYTESNKYTGFLITKNVKTKDRIKHLKAYSKELELTRKGASKELFTCVTPNTLRIEQMFNTQKRIKQDFKISDTRLLTILESKENVNLNLYNEVFNLKTYKNNYAMELIDLPSKEQKKIMVYEGYLRLFGYDLKRTCEYLKQSQGTDNSKRIRRELKNKYYDLIIGMRQGGNCAVIEDIRQKLAS